jgi:hypothetical protein
MFNKFFFGKQKSKLVVPTAASIGESFARNSGEAGFYYLVDISSLVPLQTYEIFPTRKPNEPSRVLPVGTQLPQPVRPLAPVGAYGTREPLESTDRFVLRTAESGAVPANPTLTSTSMGYTAWTLPRNAAGATVANANILNNLSTAFVGLQVGVSAALNVGGFGVVLNSTPQTFSPSLPASGGGLVHIVTITPTVAQVAAGGYLYIHATNSLSNTLGRSSVLPNQF